MKKLRCSRCKKEKTDEKFSLAPTNVSRRGRTSWCNDCRKFNSKRWRHQNRTKARAYAKKYRELNPGIGTEYTIGVTLEEKTKRFKLQGGVCGICRGHAHGTGHSKRPNSDAIAWCADHDHKTGKFRGVLCQRCNHVLGRVKDSTVLLKKMISYLEKSRVR